MDCQFEGSVSRATIVHAVRSLSLLRKCMKKVYYVDAEDASHVTTSRGFEMAFLILVMGGVFGYLSGSRPRRSKKKRSSYAVA